MAHYERFLQSSLSVFLHTFTSRSLDIGIKHSIFLSQGFQRRLLSQDFSRLVIHPILDFSDGTLGPGTDIAPFGDEPPNDTVVVLVCSSLKGTVRVGEVQLGSGLLVENGTLQTGSIVELSSIVRSDGQKQLSERYSPICRSSFSISAVTEAAVLSRISLMISILVLRSESVSRHVDELSFQL